MPQRTGRPVTADLINWSTVPLGTVQDNVLAKQLGVSAPAVRAQRVKRDIPRALRGLDWSLYPLGKVPDTIIAEMVSRHPASVQQARQRMGIACYAGRFTTTEGEVASRPEALIDLFFHEQGIAHQFQFKVGSFVADWLVGDSTLYEFAGMLDYHVPYIVEQYRLRLDKKRIFYESQGFTLVELTHADLPRYKPVGQVSFRDSCTRCGGHTGRLRKGLCNPCYARLPNPAHPRNNDPNCKKCGRLFGSPGQKHGTIRHVARGLCAGCYEQNRVR